MKAKRGKKFPIMRGGNGEIDECPECGSTVCSIGESVICPSCAAAAIVALRRVIAHIAKINQQPVTTVDRAREISAEIADYIWHEMIEFKKG